MIFEVKEEVRKVCKFCNESKALEDFYSIEKSKNRLSCKCKKCYSASAKKRDHEKWDNAKIIEYPANTLKECIGCHKNLSLDNFNNKKRGRFHKSNYCKTCTQVQSRKYQEENKEKLKEKTNIYRKLNKEKIAERQKEIYQKNKDTSFKTYRLKSKYNLSIEDYNEMEKSQNFCCMICKKEKSLLKGGLVVDHCHETGKVRSLLCWKCNVGIGSFFDNSTALKQAAEYIEFYKEIHTR